ncbi:MAG: hypothetical protein ACK5FG_10300, partial [Chryseotalea sp.]
EWMAYQYPGDKVTLTYMRDSKVNTSVVTLVNKNGLPDLIKRRIITSSAVGAQLEANEYGVKVFKIKPKSTFDQIGLPENFTIIAINRQRVKDPEEVIEFFEKYKGDGYVYGINSNKQQVELRFRLR